MKFLSVFQVVFMAVLLFGCKGKDCTTITVNAEKVRYRMAGGIGASWHAISLSSIDEAPEYKWALRYKNSRGSAWGGNPPVADTSTWKQICSHASWLGFSWIRVELSARMYEPERNKFDWENEEMQSLYRILDWAEANSADVFLQQMWSNVKWNSYPGVQPLLSAPASTDDFANGLASLIDHLVNSKKYTCLKWVCITNEPPGGTWGNWWSTGEKDALLTPALEAVRKALDQKKLEVAISGPDWTDLPPFDEKNIDFDQFIGAYDIHSYQGMDEAKEKILSQWAEWASKHNKPLFLSEMGDMRIGWKDDNPGPKSFKAALSNTETFLRGLSAGVGGFNRWSFTNRGDLDGQWQLVRTWDSKNQKYYETVIPEPAAYYGYGILTRFLSKYSDVLVTNPIIDTTILSQTIKNSKGQLTTYILNKAGLPKSIRLTMTGNNLETFYLYSVTEEDVQKPGFSLDPEKEISLKDKGTIVLDLPAQSISVLSNIKATGNQNAQNR
jgi:hypothetical protein